MVLTDILVDDKLISPYSQGGRCNVTVAISCNLSDGVILGVDSAITVPTPAGIAKVYEHGEKLFQIGKQPVGVATYGMGGIRTRSIASYLKEFEVIDNNNVVSKPSTVANIAEELRAFFYSIYSSQVIPEIERQTGKEFSELEDEKKPLLGFVIGGFSDGAYLSEVWHILIPRHTTSGSAELCRDKGNFGSNWFSLFAPIARYEKGFDRQLVNELLNYVEQLRGQPFSPNEQQHVRTILNKYEYGVPFDAMPIQDGILYVHFLVDLVINHWRFTVGAPVVGGEVQIGLVTLRTDSFQILGED